MRDAVERILTTTRRVGAMETTESTAYDALGRVVSQTDILGRTTTTTYSTDGLTTTVTTPAGATLITVRNTDGSVAHVSGTGQRELFYSYDFHNKRMRETVKLKDNRTVLSQTITNGFGQTVVEAAPSTTGFIYARSEYNAKGQLTKQYQDTGSRTTPTAATLHEYDNFGNVTKQTLALSDTPTVENSPIVETAYSVESLDDGVFQVTTQTRYNAQGEPLTSTQKQLISELDDTLGSKTMSIDERGNQSISWTEYTSPAKLTQKMTLPTSSITAETVSVDGFTIRRKDNTGIMTTASRSYTATGMTLIQTDGRGNATTTETDKAGRTTRVTDATGAATSTSYDAARNQPSVITDAMGNTSCYRYDARGRKVAEWGTGIQPAVFSYDDADRLTTLTTFRANTETVNDDPSDRTDGDTTTWTYHDATGLETRKTYADGSHVDKTYDAYNRLSVETLARGITKTHRYEHNRGLLLGTTYSDSTTARSYRYNHLGQLTQVVDDAGTRALGYNEYGEQETDSLAAEGVTHLITETRDDMGRSTGYTYAKNGASQQTVTTGYGSDGRITSAGFLHKGAEKRFGYSYLPGTNLLQTLTMPNSMTLTQSYETQRDLLTGMYYKRGTTGVVEREYSYDTLGRPSTRRTARKGTTVNDTFAYSNRSELTEATVNNETYSYAYDNIGIRTAALEESSGVASRTEYTANELNQYTSIQENEDVAFVPTFDADGNQTLVKTSTGIWTVAYNAENRPITFTNNESNTVVECTYDYMGRQASKQITENGNVTLKQRYIYRGYLQIACCDLTRTNHPCLWLITWDPTQPVATRPLAIQKSGTWYCYGWDLTKNICEVFGSNGYINTIYTYTPYGEVTSSGSTTQPIQWSCEHFDDDMSLSYYNYRYYNALDGRWITKDPLGEKSEKVYVFVNNSPIRQCDSIGLSAYVLDKPSEYHPKSDDGSGKYASQSMTSRDIVIRGLLLEGIPFFALKYPLAAVHLEHYLMNTGVDINFNMLRYLDDPDLKNAMNEELTSLAQAAKTALPGKKHIVSSTSSTVGYFSENDNLYYAIGEFHIWGNGTLEVCEDNTYTSNLSINFYNRYNWDKGKSVTIPIPLGSTPIKWIVGTDGPIRINPNNDNELIVEDVALSRLHLQGLAKEYDLKGKMQIQVSGKVGELLPTYKIITQ